MDLKRKFIEVLRPLEATNKEAARANSKVLKFDQSDFEDVEW